MSEPVVESKSVVAPAPTRIAGVRFQTVGKVYHFDASALPELKTNDYVIVETARGRQMGQVATVESYTGQRADEGPLKPIERRASGRDLAVRRYWEDKELEALIICRDVNKHLGLPIKIVKAEYSFDGSRLTFLYSSESEEKIDTKDLRQEISKSFRSRVDLRLIGPRDVAKLIEGFGACGEVRCCSRFLTEFSPVSIKMAKEQGISLNPQEITGMCGRLRCCLVYEYEQYVLARKSLPGRNKEIGTPQGRGTVVDIIAIEDSVLVQIGEQQVKVHRDQIVPLEEWEALHQRAAEPCPDDEDGTSGLHKPPVSGQVPAQTTPASKPKVPRKSREAAPRDGAPPRAEGGEPKRERPAHRHRRPQERAQQRPRSQQRPPQRRPDRPNQDGGVRGANDDKPAAPQEN